MTLHSTLVLSAFVLSFTHSLASMAGDDVSSCPPRIAVNQAISGQKPDGWSDYGSNEEHPLVSVSFSLGPPDMKALLAPSKEVRKAGNTLATWRFPVSKSEYWIACEYADTTVVMAKPLDRGTTACTAEYDNSFTRPVVRSWKCLPGEAK